MPGLDSPVRQRENVALENLSSLRTVLNSPVNQSIEGRKVRFESQVLPLSKENAAKHPVPAYGGQLLSQSIEGRFFIFFYVLIERERSTMPFKYRFLDRQLSIRLGGLGVRVGGGGSKGFEVKFF